MVVDELTLDVMPLIVTSELLPNLIAPSLITPFVPPDPDISIGPFLERIYPLPPLPDT